MNAIELLKKDHKTVKSLLAKLMDTTERAIKTRSELLEKIRTEVSIHTTLEEELFYPAFHKAGAKDEAKMVAEAKEEHRAVEELVLPDLFKTEPGSINFSGRMKVLKELLEHHIEEEEEEMFKDAAKLMSKDQLLELGKQMEEKQRQLKADM
ncbi:MAG TPA: hemerythrin domain-containing protein [Pseudomonas sabulinigri]|uniref:Hemerythrin-like domain-containing protein n=1 Tax=marine sediment metagenome TaxID=412755 RepID=A0A0F9V7N8_9ZZZZ|nr:hemerythrin domain-containing protein [Halopseudomonas sabulinigri]HEC50438.1 hemerythrin domain-containing protein [Halopseudomonas sabulinigri]